MFCNMTDLSLLYTSFTSFAQACGFVWLARSHKGERFRFLESHRRNGAELCVNE